VRYDAVIIGGGHNGLVCACYLAGAGLKVRVLERRAIVGGAAVTEEFAPGFRNSAAAYTVSLLNPKIIRELKLADHGLRIVERPFANFLSPIRSGRSRASPRATRSGFPTTTARPKPRRTRCGASSSRRPPIWAEAGATGCARSPLAGGSRALPAPNSATCGNW